MFSNERPGEDEVPPKPLPLVCEPMSYRIPEDLLDIYLETYFKYASLWCPVLDWATLDSHSQILGSPFFHNALALCAIRLRPPLIGPTDPEIHYLRAKSLFYGNYESNPLIQIISIMLFYWWSPGRPNVASLDTGRWWVGTAIRLAEEIGLNHEKGPTESYIGETSGLKRRIWWTLFVSAVLSRSYPSSPLLTSALLRQGTVLLPLPRADLVSLIPSIAVYLW